MRTPAPYSVEYRERIMEHARAMCGSRASETEILETAMYYATKWTGKSKEEARRIFIDNEPPRPMTLDDLDEESRDWLLGQSPDGGRAAGRPAGADPSTRPGRRS